MTDTVLVLQKTDLVEPLSFLETLKGVRTTRRILLKNSCFQEIPFLGTVILQRLGRYLTVPTTHQKRKKEKEHPKWLWKKDFYTAQDF